MSIHTKWLILAIVIGLYLPVAVDATVLHIAVPTLSQELGATNAQLLWIIDIYPLLMTGLILVMGSLGDKVGYRVLMLSGSAIFGIASLFAAFSPTAALLIASRALLALGASMILPGTLACLRHTFTDEKERNFALGMWVVAGGTGAAFGPLVGGFLLEHFYWGSVFLINIPIILVVMGCILKYIPKQEMKHHQHLNVSDALLLITAILIFIYSLKAGLQSLNPVFILSALFGVVLVFFFIKKQTRMSQPLFDVKLFTAQPVKYGFITSVVAMVALVGFELLISQKLQYVYKFTPLQAGLYILPFMLAVSVSGFISTPLLNTFGSKHVAIGGLVFSALAMYFLAFVNFETDYLAAIACMVVLGLGILCAFLAATSAILSGAPIEQAASAGAIEGMSYELGTGLGTTIFGLLASLFYMQGVNFQAYFSGAQLEKAESSISETYQAIAALSPEAMDAVMKSANAAFINAHSHVLLISACILFGLAVFLGIGWKEKRPENNQA